MLKQRSYARDNEESELIPTSLMIGKEKQTQVSWNFQQGDLNGLTWGHFSDGDNEVLFIVQ